MSAPTLTSVRDELGAMDAVWSALETLDHGGRKRVLAWASSQALSCQLAALSSNKSLTLQEREALVSMAGSVRS